MQLALQNGGNSNARWTQELSTSRARLCPVPCPGSPGPWVYWEAPRDDDVAHDAPDNDDFLLDIEPYHYPIHLATKNSHNEIVVLLAKASANLVNSYRLLCECESLGYDHEQLGLDINIGSAVEWHLLHIAIY